MHPNSGKKRAAAAAPPPSPACGEGSGRGAEWYDLSHIWLPYAQMKTAAAPLPVKATRGSRIILADGTELPFRLIRRRWCVAGLGCTRTTLLQATPLTVQRLTNNRERSN